MRKMPNAKKLSHARKWSHKMQEIEPQNNKFIQRPNISTIINLYIIWNRSLTIMALLVWLHILLVAPTTGSPGKWPLLDQVTQSERY
ncbi:hypothetical protein LDENG_00011160 [Lucifuga dentata]|nr:hypothetical protein LDENG_00011160 [Lucifuga dentata]